MKNFLHRMRRLQKDMNTSEFARFLGVKQQSLDKYMKGINKPSVEFILTVCSRIGVSSDWLLGLSGEEAGIGRLNADDSKKEEKKDAKDANEETARPTSCVVGAVASACRLSAFACLMRS